MNGRETFLTQPIGRLIAQNAIPAVTSMLFMAVYQVTDAMLVGRRLGPEALAAVNILYPVLALFVGLAVMIAVGGSTKIAVLLGAGEEIKAGRILGKITVMGLALGVTGSLMVVLNLPRILALLGTSGDLGTLAGAYLNSLYPFFAMMILQLILEQAVRNDGRANLATAVMVSMALLNILLDYLFLFVLNKGIAGAALATGIAQSIAASIFVLYFVSKAVQRRPGLRIYRPMWKLSDTREVLTNGSSELFNSLALGVTTFLFNRVILSHVGTLGVAAFSLVQYVILFGMTVLLGLSMGSQPIISYNYGAGLSARVRETLSRLMTYSLLAGALFFLVLHLQTGPLIALFIKDSPEAMEMALQVAGLMRWSVLLMPVGIVGSMFFTAIEKAGKSLIVAVCRSLVFTVVGLTLFPLMWQETGIWITPIFSEGATASITAFLMYRWSKNSLRTPTVKRAA